MGIEFDQIINESDLKKRAPEVISELKSQSFVIQKDGAEWFAPSDEFLKDRETVLAKSDGELTYFTSDIVYHKDKFASGADLVVDVFGSNHHGHVPRLKAAVAALGFDPRKLQVILYQYVRLKRGLEVVKMSKRGGNFIPAKEVLEEVGRDAFRFSMLSFDPQTHLDFDVELYKSQSSKNPVFYVQYAHARMANILNKAGAESSPSLDLLISPYELKLIKHLLQFPELAMQLALDLQAHPLTLYALNLAEYFHKFYENCRVLNAESEQLKQARLALVKAAKITLANNLALLGVSAPERM